MLRIIRVLSRLPTPFWMAVNMVLRRKDRRFVRRLRVDVKDARFLVVDPDDGVRHAHLTSSAKETAVFVNLIPIRNITA
jgi:hypothetical protein